MRRTAHLLGSALAALVVLVTTSVAAQAPSRAPVVRIGVNAIRGAAQTRQAWEPTAAYLAEAIPERRFEVVPMESLEQAGAQVRSGAFDFVIMQPAEYVYLEHEHGLTRVATMRNRTPGAPQTRFGGVIFVRADSAIRSLEDVRGRRVAAVGPRAWGAWMAQRLVLEEHGVEVDDLAGVDFLGFPQDNIVRAVLDGRADVGIVRTDLLERMAAAGTIRMQDLRVLNPQRHRDFPFVASTPLYPEWAFAVARHTDQALSQRVAVALLQMPSDHPAATAAANAGWTVPLDYGPVHEGLRRLRAPPYDRVAELTAAEALAQYWHVVLLVLLALVVMASVTVYVVRLNGKLGQSNHALATEMEHRKRMEQQLLVSEKMASLGQMAAGIAHEINSPLGYIYSNISVLRRSVPALLELLGAYRKAEPALPVQTREQLEELREEAQIEYLAEDIPVMLDENIAGLHRMRQIVRDIRSFSHVGDQDWQSTDLAELLRSTLNIARKSLEEKQGHVVLELGDLPAVQCIASQMAQVFLNIVSNAIDAIAPDGTITVRTLALGGGEVAVEIADDGPGMTEEVVRRVFDPFFTTKPVGSGTGLGLSISMKIVKAHGGRIEVTSEPGRGSTFRVVIPVRAPRADSEAPAPATLVEAIAEE
ncbi:MAG: PhnD/SsuA/transferrin family substrate-binding protein [Anaerolineae bacterium]|nr:PhnD/SsuA/transferrin family substrate-binding protein [Anaerolineae bacterium]